MSRQNISTGTKWEPKFGYSRAVRVGDEIRVSGTTATDDDGAVVAPNDPYEQATHIFDLIESALEEAGASLADVVRTRIFLTDIDDWEAVGTAHADAFADVRPATSIVGVAELLDPALVVEIEADAVVTDDTAEESHSG
ncbi:RidA family protein [Halobellus ordinarius]|uniref:RidA family protein n=1 Tax=Halobellus ordinarius TaxID=3075120 RepID=UPI002880A795|nr:RidA family protein [Halobellus sp. ZY16]